MTDSINDRLVWRWVGNQKGETSSAASHQITTLIQTASIRLIFNWIAPSAPCGVCRWRLIRRTKWTNPVGIFGRYTHTHTRKVKSAKSKRRLSTCQKLAPSPQAFRCVPRMSSTGGADVFLNLLHCWCPRPIFPPSQRSAATFSKKKRIFFFLTKIK